MLGMAWEDLPDEPAVALDCCLCDDMDVGAWLRTESTACRIPRSAICLRERAIACTKHRSILCILMIGVPASRGTVSQ